METSLRLLAICNVQAVKDGFGPRTCPRAKSEFSVQPLDSQDSGSISTLTISLRLGRVAESTRTNWYDRWYLDWLRPFPDIPTPQHTVLSLLNPDTARPGFEHDHHELMALTAPRAFLLIGGSQSEDHGGESDDLESWGYVNRAREVYRLLGVPDRIQYVSTNDGHKPTGPDIDRRGFFEHWLKQTPIR
jgi:hypothetical protein